MKLNRNKEKRYWGIKGKTALLIEGILLVSLLFSYIIFIEDKIMYSKENIKDALKDAAFSIVNNQVIQDSLAVKEDNPYLQEYSVILSEEYKDVDIVVIADETGRKYAHPDVTQIGEVFIGEDKAEVLADGSSYYTTKEGSMGVTLRYFSPIFKDGRQVGFVMVGKYTEIIGELYSKIWIKYALLLVGVLGTTFFAVNAFGTYIKRAMLDMEPEEIAALYLQKDTILNNVQDGVILVDAKLNVQDFSLRASEILGGVPPEKLLLKVHYFLKKREHIRMQEFVVDGKRVVLSSIPLMKENQYYGAVITLMDWEEMNQVAREMTGIEQKNKNLRATIHEFKNNLHIILGLLQLKEYEEAQSYILQIQNIQLFCEEQFQSLHDTYVQAMLRSKFCIARERQVCLELRQGSYLMEQHGYVNEVDLITIIGNLIENAIEACSMSDHENKKVEAYFAENEDSIEIEITDNGVAIDEMLRESIWQMGVSTKGNERGTGLYLVKRKIDIYHGTVEIIERDGEKRFKVHLLKGDIYE